jgi:acyl-CoA reductase-like NAD-dependent aldehyde dehydrogenase
LVFFAEECSRLSDETLPSRKPNKEGHLFRRPIGVAAVITPWNNPINSLCF